ncbi:unnamed protein product [Prorocentrum cordatum]|uniref:Uncharacterized protein n=1 Tax=Prorocentrum cordatum TaxID=2364126 RepID=A0ABN9V2M7_9DINO|nr:unnamed protein product [Polarella glacialis]
MSERMPGDVRALGSGLASLGRVHFVLRRGQSRSTLDHLAKKPRTKPETAQGMDVRAMASEERRGPASHRDVIQQPHRCFPDGRCAFDPGASPLQRWGGQLPVDVVFPLRQCRLGSPGARVSCPSRPVEMLQGWNSNAYVQAKSDSCLALPVLSRARAYSDSRNERLMQEGLSPGDVRLLRGYLCALSSRPGARVFS